MARPRLIRHHRWPHPIDWCEPPASIRFWRARGRRDDRGQWVHHLPPPHSAILPTKRTRVVLATAYRERDPTNNDAILAALCHTASSCTTRRSTCCAGG